MPKAQSLKKVQNPITSKNQKPITQFFKNINKNSSQGHEKSPSKSHSDVDILVTKNNNKRKATALIVRDTVVISDEEIHNKLENGYHTPKKFKAGNASVHKSPSGHNSAINLLQKENTPVKVTFKETDTSNYTNDKVDNSELCKLEETDKRLPLTPVKEDNNHGNNAISSNQKQSKSCIKVVVEDNDFKIHRKDTTPRKVLSFESGYQTDVSKTGTPKKSPKKGLSLLKTPQKLAQDEFSPSKSGSTVKTIECSPGTLDGFGDQWDIDELQEDCPENLDLSVMQRCEVISVTRNSTSLELRLKNSENCQATCIVEGIWLDTPLSPGEIVSIVAEKNFSGQFYVGNNAGLIVLRPDHLLSCTSVVAGVFCKRKAVLQERFRGLDSGNTAMTIGILVHELVQKALTENIMETSILSSVTDKIIKNSLQMLYESGMNEEEARSNMQQYITPLADFMQTYVAKPPLRKPSQKDQWNGRIDKVLDIEENLCCPQLGLKGKIDATVQVTTPGEKGSYEAPLELKSGMARGSAEHRGQLALYGMVLALRPRRPRAPSPGLLLYLKERVNIREVRCGHPERRDLTALRNQLAAHLARAPTDIHPDDVVDIEEAESVLQQSLPEPVYHHSACSKCPYLTLCSMHLWHSGGEELSSDHPLRALRAQAVGHVSAAHARYFRRWAALLRAEELTAAPLHALWTDAALKRSKRGTCAANLVLKSVTPLEDRYVHVFNRQLKEIDKLNGSSRQHPGPNEGEFSVVSTDDRPWIAAGVVTVANETQLSILLERDLSRRASTGEVFHIDTYESYATVVHNLTNLGALMEDTERSERLRRLIIDLESPEFEKKLPREVGRLGSRLMRSLNIEQQRGVLKALAAKDYALLRGLPGTGKTQTISVLIQMLVGLKQRVLVTAHTHSAVDTVLSRLPATLKVMRLGSSARVASNLLDRCEQTYIEKCDSVKELEEIYESMEVVGVTCLGASHAMLTRTHFDVCIVDEATQVLQCTVLRPLLAAARFVLVGDPAQLPPVVRSKPARRLGMEESLFHRLMREDSTSTLRLQYRMNRPLADLANTVAYDGALKCADDTVANATLAVDTQLVSKQSPWLQKVCSKDHEYAAIFLDVTPTENADQNSRSCTNVDEACVVFAIIEALIQCGLSGDDVGVIAPYREQVGLLRRGLRARGGECSTVDQFQGRDKPAIIYSCARREGKDDVNVKEGEILNDQRRLAVSVTRAKHKLITIGNARALKKYQPLQRLIDASTILTLDYTDLLSVVNKHKSVFL